MDYKKNQVLVRLTISGGSIMEDDKNKGITQVATLAFNQPATSTYTSTQIRNYMTGKKVGVGLGQRGDCLTVSISGSPEDLEHGFQLAYLLLKDAKLEASALTNWQKNFVRQYEASRTNADARLGEELYVMLQPDVARLRPLKPERAKAITVEEAQAWLKNVIATGIMEASIVGDLKKERALELAATYFGALPNRSATTAAIDARRVLPEQTEPRKRIVDVDSIAKRSVVLTGWRCPGWRKDKNEVLAIKLAMRILQTRVRKEIREERSLTYSAGVFSSPSTTYENISFMGIYFTADPDKAEAAMKLARELGEAFAKDGPTEEELTIAKKQLGNQLDQMVKEPGFWSGKLADLEYHGFSLDYLKTFRATYQDFTVEDIRKVMTKYVVKKGAFEIITQSQGKEEPKAE
jgi:zinc protease